MQNPTRALRPTTRRLGLLAVAMLLTTLVPTATTAAADERSAAAADEVLVRYRADATPTERSRVARDHGLTAVRTSPDGRTQVVIAEGRSPATARRELKEDPRVLAVADNHRRELTDDITNEPKFSELWGLHNTGQTIDGGTLQTGIQDVDIDGLEALRITKGDSDVIVAVIDDGVDFSHPDLASRAWTNPGEAGPLATNGIDDDANGYIDDVHGWDFCNGDNTLSDPNEDGHGTHVAGTIAASLNGTGIVGVAPGIKVMGLKFINDSPFCGQDDMAIEAIDYAASFGVPIINASWGGTDESTVLDAAIGESGALFVAAAGNAGSNMDGAGQKFYPAASTKPNVITVAAIDQRGNLASFSNYGATSVDLSAPGTNVLSSIPDEIGCNPCWAWGDGTSMAAPHVSGVAALVASVVPGASPAVLRQRLLAGAAPLAPTAGKTVTGKLLNALGAIDQTAPVASAINRHGINIGTILGSNTVGTTMTWPAATDDLTGIRDYQVQRSANGGPYGTITASTTALSTTRDLVFGTGYRFRLRARDGAGSYSPAKDGAIVTASLVQDVKAPSTVYTGTWSLVSSSAVSGGQLHRSTKAGSTVTFTTDARAIAVVGRKGPTNGQAKIYVDGVYAKTIDLHRSSTQSKVVLYNVSWTSGAVHSVKVEVVATVGHPGVEVDAFAILR
jgi:subtilisin family serine protease